METPAVEAPEESSGAVDNSSGRGGEKAAAAHGLPRLNLKGVRRGAAAGLDVMSFHYEDSIRRLHLVLICLISHGVSTTHTQHNTHKRTRHVKTIIFVCQVS